jgi:hypothetical protein
MSIEALVRAATRARVLTVFVGRETAAGLESHWTSVVGRYLLLGDDRAIEGFVEDHCNSRPLTILI